MHQPVDTTPAHGRNPALDTKPDWDQYLMSLAFVVASRSIDPSTKHGCVIVDQNHCPLAWGYNGPPRGMRDEQVPFERPDKYAWMVHSEENAILNAQGSLHGAIVYNTGRTCHRCARMLVQKGVSEIVYGPQGSHCVDEVDASVTDAMLRAAGIRMRPWKGDIMGVLSASMARFDAARQGK